MATYAIGKKLSNQILARAEQVNQVFVPKSTAVTTDVADHIYNKIYGQYTDALDKVPQQFFKMHDEIYLSEFEGTYLSASFKLSKARPFPTQPIPNGHPAAKNSYSYQTHFLSLTTSADWEPIRQTLAEYQAKAKAARNEASVFSNFVDNLIKNNKTVQRILTVWPAFIDLLPPELQASYKSAKRRKVAAARLPEGVDVDAMTARVTAYKIIAASGAG